MMIWWAKLVIFVVTAQVESSAVRSVSISYLSKNGTVIFDSPEKDLYPAVPLPGNCRQCVCSSVPLQCDPGVSVVTDGCGCCKICARQLGDNCDLENVCDHHKGLYCDGKSLTCKARPGRNCYFANKWHENGAVFSPNCRISCTCIDGDVGCFQKCKPPPPGCLHPRLTRSSGSGCCGEWRCSKHVIDHVRNGGVTTLAFRDSCIVQTTLWSSCSKTCGFGVSERVTNDNDQCKMTKETRLCIIRPCKPPSPPKKNKKVCRRNIRRNKRVRYSLSGCLSTKSFKPRYCGTCRDSRCCRPNHTKTVSIEFQCTQTRFNRTETHNIRKKMMLIHSCTCGDFCSNNDVLRPSIGLNLASDTLFNS